MSDPIVGIDLGTSNSAVALADGTGPVQVLADDGGYKLHPSVVSFHPDGGVVVGAAAKQRKIIDPKHTIYSVKRLIGRGYRSPEVQAHKARVPYEIKEGDHGQPLIVTRGGEFAVPEISAIVLDHLRGIAAARLGTEVSRAVLTVPASFGDAQRSATAAAGAIAGLTVVRVLSEPTAAALAYGHAHDLREVIAVYDFGGGTFDVSILRLDGQVYEVLGTAGDAFLGGDDLDERLVDKMVAKLLAEHRVDLRGDEVALMRLRAVAEQTKIELSRRTRAVVRVDEIADDPRGAPLSLQLEITRDELVRDVAGIVDRTFPVCREALELAGVGVDQIGDVLLVGGTTKMPYVREQVARFFRRPPRTDVGAEDAVAVGAALQAAALGRMLARPPRPGSRQHAAAARPEPPTGSGTLELAPEDGAPAAGVRRPDSEATLPRPDTSYSVTRLGAKETIETRTPAAHAPAAPHTPAVPHAPATPPSFEDPSTTQQQQLARVRPPARPPTAVPPPIPRTAPGTRPSSTLDIPALSPGTVPGLAGLGEPPAPRRPPQSPTAAPSDPTVIAPRGGPSPAPGGGPSPASTLKGLAPPVSAPPPAAATAPPQRPPVVLEVTPRGLGIATVAGYCEELIRRNSRVPTSVTKLFTTSRDRQDVVRIVVCRGESRRVDQNVVIGDLVLLGLPPRPRGETTIEVTFSIDASGTLQVQARDVATGAEQRAELDLLGGMQPQDIATSRDRLQLLRR